MIAGGGDDAIVVGQTAAGASWTTTAVANGIASHLVIEGDQPGADSGVDTVTVDDTADTADDTGTLTSTLLSGIFAGAGADMTYADLEFLTIHLGNATAGNTFTVESTHGTVANVAETVIDSGTGADHFNVETIAGKTTIDGGDGADTFRVGTATGPATASAPRR